MNILALTSSYPRFEGDPTAPFIESITRQLAGLGHTVHLVLPEHASWRRAPSDGEIHFHPYRYSPVRRWTPWGYSESLQGGIKIRRRLYALAPLVFSRALRMCASLASRHAFDVIHVHWVIPNGIVGAVFSRRSRLPLVISLHGSDISVSERSRAIGRVAGWSLARAAAVTAPSSDLLERARRLGARPPLELIHYGADVHAFEPNVEASREVRRRLGLEDTDLLILGIGRFVRMKGFDYLLPAVASFPSVRLVLVGDGDLRPGLEAQADALGLRDRVSFPGMAPRDEVPAYFGAADVVAVPSIHHDGHVDGLPNVALEAMAAGKPLIATRVGGLPQIVRDGENGLLVEERDPDALARAIGRLASDAELRRRIGANAREDVRTSLSWDAVGRRFEAVLARAAARAPHE